MRKEMGICEARWHAKINLIKIYKGEKGMKFLFLSSHSIYLSHRLLILTLLLSLSWWPAAGRPGRQERKARCAFVSVCGLTRCDF